MDKVLFKEKGNTLKREDKKGIGIGISLLINLVLIFISCFLLYNTFRAFQIYNAKLLILDQAKEEVADLRIKNIELILNTDKIQTEDYVQTDIRNRLNYSKKNEIVFVISDTVMELAKDKVGEILEPSKDNYEQKSTIELWLEFIGV